MMTSSNFSLLIVNLFVGLCRGTIGLPRALKELGYEDRWIERKFHNQDGDAVHPELVMASRDNRHALLLEAKSGANTDRDQLARYSRITSRDLVERLFMEEEECEEIDLSVVGLEEHEERLCIGLEADETAFPLLLKTDDGLRLGFNEFRYGELSSVFDPALNIDWDAVPLSWIPFDHGSDLWEVAEVVMPEVLARMVRREPRINATSVCETRSSWPIIGREERRQMEAKVKSVFAEAARSEFAGYFRVSGDDLVVTDNPLELNAARSTLGFQRLQRLQGDFLHRLRADGEQLELSME